MGHFYNLHSVANIVFPLSNYTLSYNLAKRVQFWDTCEDAVGEDFHMFHKTFWKTKGEVKGIPIFTAFNQLNVQVDDSIVSNLVAKFWQL